MVIITRFCAADTAASYDIFQQDRVSPWAFNTFEKSALNKLSLVAKNDQDVLGYILLSSVLDELTIEDISVASPYRKRGIGRKLLDASFDLAINMQLKFIFLEVRVSNKPAIELYRSMGFELVGERKNYYEIAEVNIAASEAKQINTPPPRENAYVMKKAISALSSN